MATTTTKPVFGAQPSAAEIAARVAGYGKTALTVNVLGDLIRDARAASARPARVGAA